MDTVTDMDMLMVTHMEVMNMEDRVSPGTVFVKAILPTFGSPHFKVLKWETILVRIHWQIFVLCLVPSLDQEDPLEEGMATHSRILAWRIPWTEEPGGLQSIGSHKVRHN